MKSPDLLCISVTEQLRIFLWGAVVCSAPYRQFVGDACAAMDEEWWLNAARHAGWDWADHGNNKGT